MPTIYPPYVIERSSRGERTYDIFSRLLMDRIVFMGTAINDDVANIIIAQLLFLGMVTLTRQGLPAGSGDPSDVARIALYNALLAPLVFAGIRRLSGWA